MLFIANTFFEWELEGNLNSKNDLKDVFSINPMVNLLQFIPLIFLNARDTILVTEIPHIDYLQHLKHLGITELPHFLTFDKLHSHPFEINSWGASQKIAHFAKQYEMKYEIPSFEVVKKINSKVWNFGQTETLPYACLIPDKETLTRAVQGTKRQWVLKTEQGFSGRGHKIFTENEMVSAIDFCQKEWLQARPLLLEPWVERVLDFSSQWNISQDGTIQLFGVTKCLNSLSGTYEGTEVGRISDLFGTYQNFIQEHLIIAEERLKHIFKKGFFGCIGFDAMLYKNLSTGKTTLHPIVEVNARMTMSSALLRFHQRFCKKKKKRYLFQTQKKSSFGLLPPNSKKQLIICD